MHTLCQDFQNLSMIMKNIFDGNFKPKALHIPQPMLSHKLFNTKIMFTHVIFAKIMVDVISSICYPSFIFSFYDVTSTPL